MTVSTISTYARFQSTLGNVNSLENTLNTEQEQLSSGNADQSYTEMGNQTQQYMSLTDALNQTSQYITSHATVEATVNTTSSALGQMITTANSLQSLISQRISGAATSDDFSQQLTGLWQTMSSEMNTQLNGQYLFSGSKTATAPVDASKFPALIQQGVPDTGYYQGNSQQMTATIDSQTSVTYNVTGDNPAFQQLFAGVATAMTGDTGNNTDMLKQAETFVQTAVAGMTQLQAKVGAVGAQFAASDTNLQNSKLYLQGLQQSIGNTDIVSVSTQLATNQGILQAAFEAFSKINSLNLAQYLNG